MDPGTWLLLGALGAWSALDSVALGQFMISRPLVTGTLSGLILGDPLTGFILGLLMELAHLSSPPAGGVRLPEPGPAAVGGTTAAVLLGGSAGLALGTAWGLAWALAGGKTVTLQRRWQGRLVAGLEKGRVGPEELSRRVGLALGAQAARGAAVTWAGVAGAAVLPAALAQAWPLGHGATLIVLGLLLAFPTGLLVRSLPAGQGQGSLLVAGAVLGLLLGGWVHGGL